MGLPRLFGLCLALFSFSAINVAQANYIYDPVTRTWLPTATTVLAPPNSGSVLIPDPKIPPNPTANNGGFTTTSGGSIRTSPVNGTTQRLPITINGTATKTAVNNALTSRLLKGNLAGFFLGVGIQELLNGVQWIIDEGGNLKKIETSQTTVNTEQGGWTNSTTGGTVYGSPQSACEATSQCVSGGFCAPNPSIPSNLRCCNPNNIEDCRGLYWAYNPVCPANTTLTGLGCVETEEQYLPVSPQDVQNTVDNSYNPHPSDYPLIVSEPSMQPTGTTVLPIPTLNFPSVQTSSTDLSTGQTTVTDTQTKLDFEIHDNGSQQPKIEEKKTQQTDTYQDGLHTGTSTTTSSSGVVTGGSPAPVPTLELPPFCVWAGIVCDWIGWTQEPIEDDLDLASLITDEDYERNYSINFGDNSCPAPIEINVVFLNQTVQISYEPACELASYAKPFVLISAYIFAIFITLGVVRNG